ncbi:MAG: glucoamylase family protein [Bacteroidales bacterium]
MKKIFILLLPVLIITSCRNNPQKGQDDSLRMSDDSLMNLVEYRTFNYFWDGAEPNSGMARERFHVDNIYLENDKQIVTTGGTGFGLMAILVGIERGFITRGQGIERLSKIVNFLEKADRYHGAWAHWIDGETGKTKPFNKQDDGADIVETAYLAQGLIAVLEYLDPVNPAEKKLAEQIEKLWKDIDWAFFTQGNDVLFWHWSPTIGWKINFPVQGYNECLILYVMAASSPTHPIKPSVYHNGWARGGGINSRVEKYGYTLTLKHNFPEDFGGPLFWSHYSYLGLDPRHLKDKYANYWDENVSHATINYLWCVGNPKNFKGYDTNCWGLTASYSVNGYAAHAPGMESDLGVISPTAALASFPYTPQYSMQALRHFYYELGDSIWGEYGFYDAFSEQHNYYPKRYLAIDQGPIVVMMENYRTGLLWNLFMKNRDIRDGLSKLGFTTGQ